MHALNIEFNGPSHGGQQALTPKGFDQKFDRTLLHGFNGLRNGTFATDKDERDLATLIKQLGLQFNSRHTWHADISHNDRRNHLNGLL